MSVIESAGQLVVTVNGERHAFGPGVPVVLGRSPGCQVVIADSRVSRRHLEISRQPHGWLVRDLGSANGTFYDGQRWGGGPVSEPTEIRLGHVTDGPLVELSVASAPIAAPPPATPAAAAPGVASPSPATVPPPPTPPGVPSPPPTPSPVPPPPEVSSPAPASSPVPPPPPDVPSPPPTPSPVPPPPPLSRPITIGRDKENDIVLTDLLVSRRHARLEPTPYGFQVQDLGSSNRTFVNGVPITSAPLQAGDLLTIGRTRFVQQGGQLREVTDEPAAGLTVNGISYTLPNGTTLTDNVSLQVNGARLVALLGPSGAGKSTLFRLLCGELEPTGGNVLYQNVDVHTHYAEVKSRIGIVPQHTIAHQRLTAQEALQYAAQLRLSGDTSAAERDRRVQQVVSELGLSKHAGTRVDRLSGGQQRRLSIGFELLTRTSLLMLDEPTSGLDPALAFDVMKLLRRLADEGRQVLVTTHDTAHLNLCDSVVIMGAGGKLAYVGPPDGIAAHFGTDQWPEIFSRLAIAPAGPSGGATAAGKRARAGQPRPRQAATRPAGKLVRRQFGVLFRRQVRLLFADRGYLAFLAAMPVALAVLALAVPGGNGLGDPFPDPSSEAMRLLVVLIVGATFTGMAASVRDLVGERPIFRHERAAGLTPEAYLRSKLAFFATVAIAQSVLLVGCVRLIRPGPDTALLLGSGTLEVIIAVSATAVACTIMGLLVSALTTTVEQTTPPLVVAVMAQLVLCGGVIPVTGRAVLEQASWLAPARWGYASAAATTDLRRVSLGTPDDVLWSHHPAAWLGGIAAMIGISIVFALLTRRLLRRR
ncbi:FHA domain-containing protein [Natronosporangium hydrolyticum]|uniref:FHA domain-containing protein n=1 Tax=Natronosporangium hydrolyticum TaxID=2811111 RepID=A0A895YEW5_9ACTN|nr:FHA domain-containing protein [Natronosporangium hydrolyticum]QSB14682.1 FHA domain-containing protein [Natronosporangium hydrolyticum]